MIDKKKRFFETIKNWESRRDEILTIFRNIEYLYKKIGAEFERKNEMHKLLGKIERIIEVAEEDYKNIGETNTAALENYFDRHYKEFMDIFEEEQEKVEEIFPHLTLDNVEQVRNLEKDLFEDMKGGYFEMRVTFKSLKTFYEKAGLRFWRKARMRGLFRRNEKIWDEVKEHFDRKLFWFIFEKYHKFLNNYSRFMEIFEAKRKKIRSRYPQLEIANIPELKEKKDIKRYKRRALKKFFTKEKVYEISK